MKIIIINPQSGDEMEATPILFLMAFTLIGWLITMILHGDSLATILGTQLLFIVIFAIILYPVKVKR